MGYNGEHEVVYRKCIYEKLGDMTQDGGGEVARKCEGEGVDQCVGVQTENAVTNSGSTHSVTAKYPNKCSFTE